MNHHPRTVLGQCQRQRFSQADGAPGDNRDFPVDFYCGITLLSGRV